MIILVGWAVLAALCAGGATLLFLVAALARIIVRSSSLSWLSWSYGYDRWRKSRALGRNDTTLEWKSLGTRCNSKLDIITINISISRYIDIINSIVHQWLLSFGIISSVRWLDISLVPVSQISVWCQYLNKSRWWIFEQERVFKIFVRNELGDLELWGSAAEEHFYQFHQYSRSQTHHPASIFAQFYV